MTDNEEKMLEEYKAEMEKHTKTKRQTIQKLKRSKQ